VEASTPVPEKVVSSDLAYEARFVTGDGSSVFLRLRGSELIGPLHVASAAPTGELMRGASDWILKDA